MDEIGDLPLAVRVVAALVVTAIAAFGFGAAIWLLHYVVLWFTGERRSD